MPSQQSEQLVQQAYIAYYGRPADQGGLEYWACRLDQEGGLGAIIESFGNSEEFQQRFGALDEEQLVNNVYQQLFSRDSDPAGLEYYSSRLAEGASSLASITLDVLYGATGADKSIVDNRVTLAEYYTNSYSSAGVSYDEGAREILMSVDASASSLQQAQDEVDSWVVPANLPVGYGAIDVGGQARGTIEVPADEDWFAIELQADKTYLFSLHSDMLETPYLQVFNSQGWYEKSDAQSYNESKAELSFQPDVSGTYYLAASELGNDDTGEYTLAAMLGQKDDFADSVDTGGVLELGGEITGEIENLADEDWFVIELSASETYVFSLHSTALETPYLQLFDNHGWFRESDAKYANEGHAELSFQPDQSGIYYLSASQLDGNDTGEYRLKAKLGVSDDFSHTVETQGVIRIGGQAVGQIENLSDEDWFAVELAAGETYVFSLASDELETPYLQVYDPQGWFEKSDAQYFNEDQAELSFRPEHSGVYYLSASQLGNDDTGQYTLTASRGLEDDYDNTIATDGRLAETANITGNIENVSDDDWFAVELTAGETYVFSLKSDELSSPYLQLYDSQGWYEASDAQYYNEAQAELSFQPSHDGVYYVSASQLGDDEIGRYTLGMQKGQPDDYAQTTATEGSVALGSWKQGAIENLHDEDWFAVELTANETYIISLKSDELDTPYLQLFDSRGWFEASDAQYATESAAELSFQPEHGGTYYLSASDLGGDSSGLYEIGIVKSQFQDDFLAG